MIEVPTAAEFAALAVRVTALEGATPPPDPDTTPVPVPVRWPSGGSDNTNDIAGLRAYAAMRGRACDLGTVYSTRSTWAEFVRSHGTSGQISKHADKGVALILQTSPFPTDVGTGATYERLVAGEYDGYWKQIAELVAAREAQGYTVRLSVGWEANGDYMAWGGNRTKGASHYKDPAQYRAGIQRIYKVLRSVYGGVKLIWCVNAHATPASVGTTNSWDLYPGEGADVGIDSYDHYPPSKDKAAFDRQANAQDGILWLAGKARTAGVQLWVPEWGVNNNPKDVAEGKGGGDNPLFLGWMFDLFKALYAERLPDGRPLLGGEFYFGDPTRVPGNVDSSLLDGNPKSAAKYHQLYTG